MTLGKTLQHIYLRLIEEEETAKRTMAQICPVEWYVLKRVVRKTRELLQSPCLTE
jgi:hypothetical protein